MNNKTEEEKEIRKLKAEISIIRSKLKIYEKENESLKQEKSKFILNRNEIEYGLKRKFETKEKEEQILENQRKMFKSGVEMVNSISPKFILQSTFDFTNPNLEIQLKNLRFFKDFFFDDFYSIPDGKSIEIVEYFQNISQKEFVEAFELFSCQKKVFIKFSPAIFDDNSFVKIKLNILQSVQPEWILEVYESHLKRFIDKNKENLLEMFANFSEKSPFYLDKIFSKNDLNHFLNNFNPFVYKILFFIAKNNIKGFIDHTNLHLIPKKFIKMMFGSNYFDIVA